MTAVRLSLCATCRRPILQLIAKTEMRCYKQHTKNVVLYLYAVLQLNSTVRTHLYAPSLQANPFNVKWCLTLTININHCAIQELLWSAKYGLFRIIVRHVFPLHGRLRVNNSSLYFW